MLTTLRAVLSLALLVGFYGYAFGIAAAFLVLGVVVASFTDSGRGTAALILLGLLMAGSVLRATWKVARAKPTVEGLPVPEQRAPELWAMVRHLAAAVDTRPPDEIRLVPEVNAAVTEHSRLLGLVGGRRYLFVGLPLLQAFTVSQLRSVLAHELGHYSHQHVRLAEPVHRGRLLIGHTLEQLARGSWLAFWLLRLYAYLYFLVSAAVSQVQEVEADRASARLAGRAAAISTLRDLPGLAAAWQFYLEMYVAVGLPVTKLAPANVLSYFPTLLAARSGELAAIRAQPPAQRSRWDTHPSPAERIAMLEREPDVPVPVDLRPAGLLVPHLDAATAELEALEFDFGDRPRVPFDQYLAATAQAMHQQEADRLYRFLPRIAGPAFPGLATVLDLLAAGRYPDLAAGLAPASAGPEEAYQVVREALDSAIAVAITSSGVGQWRPSWSAAPQLVDADGTPLDHQGWAERAIKGEASVVRAELAAHGVDLMATASQPTVTAAQAQALAGLLHVRVNGKRHDLAILDAGLLVLPALSTRRPKPAQKRLLQVLEAPAAALTNIPGARFIPYEEMVAARHVRRLHVRREFQLYTGERLVVRPSSNTQEMGPGWLALAEVMKPLQPASS